MRVIKKDNVDIIKFIMDNSTLTTSGCWQWTRTKLRDGYGRMRHMNKMHLAHRMSYEVFKDRLPDDLLVMHSCDNPGCVNPMHLFMGTNKDNSDDKIKKDREGRSFSRSNRLKTHCVNGHELSGNNVYFRHRPGGGRICKTCIVLRKHKL